LGAPAGVSKKGRRFLAAIIEMTTDDDFSAAFED